MSRSNHHPSLFREWFNAFAFSLVAAILIRWLVVEAFTIPSSSMEKTLMTGDFLFVSKLHYGARTPRTPLKVPLTHQTLPGTGIRSYLDWIQLPQYRLPGFSRVKQGDQVVFNYPMDLDKPIDLRTYFIKRCVGLPGDMLQIKDGKIYINEEPITEYPGLQYRYHVATAVRFPKKFFSKYGIREYYPLQDGYFVHTTPERAQQLAQVQLIEDVRPMIRPLGMPDPEVYPSSTQLPWNADQWGPLAVPARGTTIPINEQTLAQYERIITHHEGHKKVKIDSGKLWIDEQLLATYTFQKDYYFMMGDNRHNSKDSRFWSFVPQDHIVGKAIFVLFSVDSDQSGLSKIRWGRLFRPV